MLYVKSALGFFQTPKFCWAVSNISDRHAFVEALFIQPIFCPVQKDCAVFYNVLSLAKISSASSFHYKWSCFLLVVCMFKMQLLKYLGQNCTCSHCHLHCVSCSSRETRLPDEKCLMAETVKVCERYFCWRHIFLTGSRRGKMIALTDGIEGEILHRKLSLSVKWQAVPDSQ